MTVEVGERRRVAAGGWRKAAAFAGPGYLIAVGYVDPGNWATDIEGGARYGFTLVSVIAISNALAIFLQTLSLRLGIATGRDLAWLCRDRLSLPASVMLWITAEIAIIACDLVEVIGAAIALQLLFGLPLLAGVAATTVEVFLVLWLQNRGMRYVEALVMALLLVIGACLAGELAMARTDFGALAAALVPSPTIVTDPDRLYLALGILGATVMPHNLYLHSAIVQSRALDRSPGGKREAIRFATIDSAVALFGAFALNVAILVLAVTLHTAGHQDVREIQQAYLLLAAVIGSGAAQVLFAIALLAAGQLSAVTGTMAGQIVMEGFLRWQVPPRLRRLATRALAILPAALLLAIVGDSAANRLLVFSQVVMSLQLVLTVAPLLMFTGSREVMGPFASSPLVRVLGGFVAAGIGLANGWLVWQML